MLRDREPLRDRIRARGDDPDCEAARIFPYSYLHAAVQEVVLEVQPLVGQYPSKVQRLKMLRHFLRPSPKHLLVHLLHQ